MEGNSYIIGNYVLDSSKKADNGGFFATIGTPTNYCGSVKNITFQPRYISLTNCNAVGAVAGSIYGSILVNIKVDGNVYNTELNGLTILGKNAVGGIVGIAEGAFVFNNVESNISVNSTYRSALNGHSPQEYGKESISKISYAGLIAGVANGYGKINYVKAFGDNVSVAENAALLFGYVGKNVVAENLIAMGSFNQKIKPDVYGGVIAARNSGTLKDIQIIGDSAAGYNGFFAFDNYIPLAVGNIVGFMSGGKIENAVVNTKIVAQSGVESLGGAVGLLNSGEIVDVLIHGNITGGYKIGGIVGQVREAQSSNKILIKNSFHNGRIISNSSSDIVAVGTVIGFVANYSNDGSNGGITIDFEEGGNGISIVVSDEFKNNISEKLETGEYTSEIMITTYSSSSSTEIWAGIAVVEDNKTLQKSFIKHTLTIYNIEANRNNVYAPLAGNYKINGENV